MAFKYIYSQLLSSFDRNNILDILLFLFPKERDTASDLQKTIKMVLVSNDELRLNKISYIWIIINSSWYKSSSCHSVSSSRYYHNFYFLSIKHLSFLFNVALYYRNSPKRINILKFEVLSYFIVPQISFIHKLFSKLIWIIFSGGILKFDCGLSLLAACYICMITIIKALGFEQFLNSIYKLLDILRQTLTIKNVSIKRNEVYSIYLINIVTRWHLGD